MLLKFELLLTVILKNKHFKYINICINTIETNALLANKQYNLDRIF